MKKLLISLCFIIFSMPAFAEISSIDLNGLTEEQRAQLVIEANKMKKVKTYITSEDLQEYAVIGQKYGIALANVAREMGVAVNDIADTYIGKIAVFLVVWKVIGEDIVGLFVGLLWFFTAIPLWIYFFRRMVIKGKLVNEILDEKGKIKERVYDPFFRSECDIQGLMAIMMLVLMMVVAAGFFIIF